ncbi:MAG: hypothetical protein IT305_22890 [Chloroflexi bacterium]|nr:hypothetical protein [Chloroflexota bacterium]
MKHVAVRDPARAKPRRWEDRTDREPVVTGERIAAGGLPPLTPCPPDASLDEAERARLLVEVCRRDLVALAGLGHRPTMGAVAVRAFHLQVRRFARDLADFDRALAVDGVASASRELARRYGGCLIETGAEHVPTNGPVLLVANHPGLLDTLAVYATAPRPDVRALARPQPLLTLLSTLAPNLLFLPDDGPTRVGGLRSVLQALRAGSALLIVPAGHLEPEPALLGWPLPPGSERGHVMNEATARDQDGGGVERRGTMKGDIWMNDLAGLARDTRSGDVAWVNGAGHAERANGAARAGWANGAARALEAATTSEWEPLSEWSPGVGTLIRLAARHGIPLQVVPTAIAGALSAEARRRFDPLIRLRRTTRGREDLTAVLQLAFPRLSPTTVQVCYGRPLAAAELAASGEGSVALTERVRTAVRQLLAGAPDDARDESEAMRAAY